MVHRIFYSVNRRDNGKISWREFKQSDLFYVFEVVDKEEDINKVENIHNYRSVNISLTNTSMWFTASFGNWITTMISISLRMISASILLMPFLEKLLIEYSIRFLGNSRVKLLGKCPMMTSFVIK